MKIIAYFSLFALLSLVSCSQNNTLKTKTGEQNLSLNSQTGDTMNENISNDGVVDATLLEQSSYTSPTETPDTNIVIHPIQHATMVIDWGDTTIYVDPAEELSMYEGQKKPNMILVTHEHQDHFNPEVLSALVTDGVELISNQAVYDKLDAKLQAQTMVMNNMQTIEKLGFSLEALAAYNIREDALKFHPKGRDNGYILQKDGKRVYISGDSEDTPEMRALKDIDIAFVSMNLPYTMPIESAISGIVAFAPKVVFPYHFRGSEGLSDVAKLKTQLISETGDIDVILHNWYNASSTNKK